MRKFLYGLLALVLATTGIAYADSIITGSKPFTFIPGTTISSSQVNADFDYIINQVNTNAAKNGANSSITALLGLTTPIDATIGGSPIWNATTVGGTANAITVSATRPAVSSFSYATGNIITIVPTATNTATTTINVNGLGAKNILKTSFSGLIALAGGELTTGNMAFLYYDGTQFIHINVPNLFGTATSITAAATTDLGTIGSHNATITGNTGITAFGSTANLAFPLYYVRFTGTPTLTFNATSLITPNSVNIVIAAGDSAWLEYVGSGNWRVLQVMRINASPTVQRFTSGTGATYTPTAGTRYIKVRMCGGGGGGGAANTNNGAAGVDSSFGSWTAIKGNGGPANGGTITAGGTGGANGTGTLINRVDGGSAAGGVNNVAGAGGLSVWGGNGVTGTALSGAAKANSCAGGSGASNGTQSGGGGGAGEAVEFYVNAPTATTYTVGGGGNGGAAGTTAGGNGGAGVIIVEEFY